MSLRFSPSKGSFYIIYVLDLGPISYQFSRVRSDRVGWWGVVAPNLSHQRTVHKPIGRCPRRRRRLEIITSHHDHFVSRGCSCDASNDGHTDTSVSSPIVAGSRNTDEGY